MNTTPIPDLNETHDEYGIQPENEAPKIQEARLWCDDGWTARIIKNEDDDGWAVEMTKDGESEPALISPWTMGRDKKNPKPIDSPAFYTLVKTANEILRRHEQQLHALLHKNIRVSSTSEPYLVKLDIVPDEDNPYAVLSALDAFDELVAQVNVPVSFKLNMQSATQWIEKGFKRPS